MASAGEPRLAGGWARHQLRGWLAQPTDDDLAARLSGPAGLWSACREAARADDRAFLDELARSGVGAVLDDELAAASGVRPGERAAALVAAARLACRRFGPARSWSPDGLAAALAELQVIALGLNPPGLAPWHRPEVDELDLVGAARNVDGLVEALVERSAHPALVLAADLLADISGPRLMTGVSGPVAGPVAVRVLLGAANAGAARLVVRLVPGAGNGLFHDTVAGPLTRWDVAFEAALHRAWWAAGAPAAPVRWSLSWERSGEPVDLVAGPSIGLGAALAILALTEPGRWRIDPGWAVTGGVDETGTAVSLLGAAGQVTGVYRDKLAGGAGHTVVLPAADDTAVRDYARRAGADVELWAVDGVADLAADAGSVDVGGDPADAVCPYKGLVFFTAEDEPWFHGRERLVVDLVGRLRDQTLVGVVGRSGAGKSSLVRAGLLPALARDALPASGRWQHVVCTPGHAPWVSLLDALRPFVADASGADIDVAAVSSRVGGLAELLAGRPRHAPTFVVVIDQFEEVFTLAPAEDAASLLAALAEVCRTVERVRVVPVVRADYYGNASIDPDFAWLLSNRHVLVGPMTTRELRRAVTAPAARAGLHLEPAMVEAVLDDVVDQPGALPHLSTALRETWARRDGTTLTLAGYLASGGVAHAIARLADDLVNEADADAQADLRALFTRLLTDDDEQHHVRRALPLDELTPGQVRLLPELLARRLLTADDEHVELVHDALVVAWPRLHEWLGEDRDDVRLHAALAQRARDWSWADRDHDLLERGARLARFAELAERRGPAFNQLELDFLDGSRHAEQASLSAERSAARRTRRLLGATSVLLVLALLGASVALVQRNRAADRQREAETARNAQQAGAQAARAQSVLGGDSRARAALLSLAALDAAPNFEAVAGLADALSSFDRPVDTIAAHADDLLSGTVSGDGTTLASGGVDRAVRIWDADRLQPRAVLTGADPVATMVSLSPDASRVVAGSCDPNDIEACTDTQVRLWSVDPPPPPPPPVATVAVAAGVPTPAAAPTATAPTATWDTGRPNVAATWVDEDTVVIAHLDGLSAWTAQGAPAGPAIPASALGGQPRALVSGPDGRVATGAVGGAVRWWRWGDDAATARVAQVGADVGSLAFSHDGTSLAVGDASGRVTVLDTATAGSRHPDADRLRTSEDQPVLALAFSADDTMLVGGGGSRAKRQGGDNDVRLWSMEDGLLVQRLVGAADVVRTVGFRADGRIVVFSSERRIRVFEAAPVGLRWRHQDQQACGDDDTWWLTETGRCWLTSVAVGGDGSRFVTAGWDRRITLWDAATTERLQSATDPDRRDLVPFWTWAKRMGLSDDGRRAATPTDDGGIQLWDIDRDTLGAGARLPGPGPGDTAAAEDRADVDGDGEPDAVFVNAVEFDPTGHLLVSANSDGGVVLWDLDTGTARWRRSHGPATWSLPTFVNQASFNPDGTRVVSAGGDARLHLWDVADGAELATTPENSYVQNAAAWSPDGASIFSAGSDGVLRLWNPDLTLQREFALGVTSVASADFNGDASLVVVADQERVVRVLDPVSGRQLAAFPVEFEPLQATFSPDERTILVTDKGGQVSSYSGPASWRDDVCRLTQRNLTRAEWDGFVGPDRSYVRLCPDLPSGEGAPADAPAATDIEANIRMSLARAKHRA